MATTLYLRYVMENTQASGKELIALARTLDPASQTVINNYWLRQLYGTPADADQEEVDESIAVARALAKSGVNDLVEAAKLGATCLW